MFFELYIFAYMSTKSDYFSLFEARIRILDPIIAGVNSDMNQIMKNFI